MLNVPELALQLVYYFTQQRETDRLSLSLASPAVCQNLVLSTGRCALFMSLSFNFHSFRYFRGRRSNHQCIIRTCEAYPYSHPHNLEKKDLLTHVYSRSGGPTKMSIL